MSTRAELLRGLRQPDGLSCGATCLVGVRMLTDPAYAARLSSAETRTAEVLATHRRLTRLRDEAGRPQVPWPRALGTPPWALARALDGRVTRPRWDEVVAAVRAGHPVPLYVGSRLLPRHVVLAVDLDDADLVLHDPARGRAVRVDRVALEGATLPFRGRTRAWWVVLPGDHGRVAQGER